MIATPPGAALVVNADGPFGAWAVEAMAGRGGPLLATVTPGRSEARRRLEAAAPGLEILELAADEEGAWERLAAALRARFGGVAILVSGLPPDGSGAGDLLPAWLAMKHGLSLAPQREAGAMVVLRRAPDAGDPRREGDLEAMRISMASLLHDAMQLGVQLRANRLVLAAGTGEAAFKSALGLLTDARSSFMTGAEIALAAGRTGAAQARTDLAGKVVLVTGATSGIGRATAVAIGACGARVAIGGRKLDRAYETLELVRAAGGDGMVVRLDVTDEAAWRAAIAEILAAWGALHGLVNNAGESRNRRIDQLTAGDLSFLIAINYEGALLGMRAVVEPIRVSGGGAIVNVSSVAGVRGGPGGSAYSASKAAMIGATRSFAAALPAEARVRVNAIQPGLIWSDSVAESLGEEGARRFRAMIEPKTPLGRVGRPEEIGRVAAWLMSDPAAVVTGQAINISGGLELGFP